MRGITLNTCLDLYTHTDAHIPSRTHAHINTHTHKQT